MKKEIITDWITEDTFFDRCKSDPKLRKIDTKWSNGSSPIFLIKAGYIEKEEWEKCFWYQYPSQTRCFKCEFSTKCDKFVK